MIIELSDYICCCLSLGCRLIFIFVLLRSLVVQNNTEKSQLIHNQSPYYWVRRMILLLNLIKYLRNQFKIKRSIKEIFSSWISRLKASQSASQIVVVCRDLTWLVILLITYNKLKNNFIWVRRMLMCPRGSSTSLWIPSNVNSSADLLNMLSRPHESEILILQLGNWFFNLQIFRKTLSQIYLQTWYLEVEM